VARASDTRPIWAPRSQEFDFAKISIDVPRAQPRLFDGKGAKSKDSRKDSPKPKDCYEKCGGEELGSFECKLGPDGMPTAEVDVIVREKDPCLAPCVSAHEQRHARDLAPICREVASCLKHARGDVAKQNACLDAYEKKVARRTGGTECAAYQAELDCLARRSGAPECRNSAKLQKHLARTRCYHDCFCDRK
jgi:hypothetical protein